MRLRATDAYGAPQRELVVRISGSRIAPRREQLRVGEYVALDNGLTARVISIAANGDVTVDANHKLAGLALRFNITLLDIECRQLPSTPDGLQWAIFALGHFHGKALNQLLVPYTAGD